MSNSALSTFNLEQELISDIYAKFAICEYDLPYSLPSNRLEKIKALVENASTAYSLEIKKSPVHKEGILLRIENLEI